MSNPEEVNIKDVTAAIDVGLGHLEAVNAPGMVAAWNEFDPAALRQEADEFGRHVAAVQEHATLTLRPAIAWAADAGGKTAGSLKPTVEGSGRPEAATMGSSLDAVVKGIGEQAAANAVVGSKLMEISQLQKKFYRLLDEVGAANAAGKTAAEETLAAVDAARADAKAIKNGL
jgi:hypothetical protein